METSLRDAAGEAQSETAEQASRSPSPVRELTPPQLDEQRRLVRASLLLGIG